MEYKEVFMIVATNIGNIYRSVFSIEIFSWRKIVTNILFSTLLGSILVLYVIENHIALWLALTLAVLLGMISANIGMLILNLGQTSEKKLGKIGADLIDTKIRNVIGLDKAETNSPKQEDNGTDSN